MTIPITDVQSVTGVSATKAATTPSSSMLGKDDFLKLLVAQLQNQDPLNPVSNDQFVTQSAQFSTVEALTNIQKDLDAMAGAGGTTGIAQSTGLLGHSVTANSALFSYDGSPVTLPFTLTAPVSSAALEVTDSSGNVLSRVSLGSRPAGAQTASFSAALAGRPLPAGQYSYRIVSDAGGGQSTVLDAIAGSVSGIGLADGKPVVMFGSQQVPLADVVRVTQ